MGLRLGFLLFFLSFFVQTHGQTHAKWTARWNTERQCVEIECRLDPHWHLYSPQTDKNLGPIAVSVRWDKNKSAKPLGKFTFTTPAKSYNDQNFGGTVYIWEDELAGMQKFRIKKNTKIRGFINYMICDDNRCIPPTDVEITIQTEQK